MPPLEDGVRLMYERMAKDPVAFFLLAEKAGKVLDITKVIQTLLEFRRRVSVPSGGEGRLSLSKANVDSDLVVFSERGNTEDEHFVALFRIMRRLGFSTADCVTTLLHMVDLEKTRDPSPLPERLMRARDVVDAMVDLPPPTRQASFNAPSGN